MDRRHPFRVRGVPTQALTHVYMHHTGTQGDWPHLQMSLGVELCLVGRSMEMTQVPGLRSCTCLFLELEIQTGSFPSQ